MRLFLSSVAGLAAIFLACSSGDDDPVSSREPPPDAGQRPDAGAPVEVSFTSPELTPAAGDVVVLVQDTGFDLDVPGVAGRVLGAYHIACAAPSAPATDPNAPAPTFEQQKASLLESLKVSDRSCRIEQGLTLRKSATLAELAPSRDAWNAAIRAKTSVTDVPGWERIAYALGGEDTYEYHGTWTSSAIGYQSQTKLVVVSDGSILAAGETPACPTPETIAQTTRLYTDPDVVAAYSNAPLGAEEEDGLDLLRRFRVAIVNESFGPPPAARLAEVCPGPDWAAYYAASVALDEGRRRALEARGTFDGIDVLTTKSAGNEGADLLSPATAMTCGGDRFASSFGARNPLLVVGSYGLAPAPSQALVRSKFSNFGACVDLYAPGEKIVVEGPEGWLVPTSGTSFSAPLTARLAATLPVDAGGDGGAGRARRDALLALRDGDGNVPLARFPRELLYDAKDATIAPASVGRRAVADAPIVQERFPRLPLPRRLRSYGSAIVTTQP